MRHQFKFLFVLAMLGFVIPGQSQDPFIPRYDALKRSERCFSITTNAYQQFGSIWLRDKIDFSKDTVLNFTMYLGDRDANGADGIALVMHQDPRDTFKTTDEWIVQYSDATYDHEINPQRLLLEAATGEPGGGLGYGTHHSNEYWNEKITPSIAIEFDTWDNNDYQDGDGDAVTRSYADGWDHTSVVYNGDLYTQQKLSYNGDSTVISRTHPLKPASVFGSANNPDGSVYHNIEDDRCYAVQIRWKVNGPTQTLTVAMGLYTGGANFDNLKPIMHHTDTMLNLFDDTKLLRVGFTGSTGGSINEQTICFENNAKVLVNDDIANTEISTPVYVDVYANDSDPSGDIIGPGHIAGDPSHGSARFVIYQGKEHLLYTPYINYTGYDTIYYVCSDVNSTKCYAQMDTAEVVIKVECKSFDLEVNKIKDHVACTPDIFGNGSAQVLGTTASNAYHSIWHESFSDLSNGVTIDIGETAWETTIPAEFTGHAEINGNRFWVSGGNGGPVVWESEKIDVSGFSEVQANVHFLLDGDFPPGEDTILVEYRLDDENKHSFIENSFINYDFTSVVSSISGISGNTFQIVITFYISEPRPKVYINYADVVGRNTAPQDVRYHWYEGTNTLGAPFNTANQVDTLKDGTYTIVGEEISTGCLSNAYQLEIAQVEEPIGDFTINQVSGSSNCAPPYNGALEVVVNSGSASDYDFEWYEGLGINPPSIGSGTLLSNVAAGDYSVNITSKASGCEWNISAMVDNLTTPPYAMIEVENVTACDNPYSGLVSASVPGRPLDDYHYYWYFGTQPKVTPDSIGNSIHASAQFYTLKVVDKVTGCLNIYVAEVLDMTDCNFQYSGMITDRSGNPIDDFPVEITADGQTNSRKTSNGRYSGEVAEKSDITIIPTGEVRANMGVTTLDLILTRMQILGIRSMDAYQKVAADVNRSGSISAMDVTEMKQIILHKKEDFDNAPSLTCINQGTYVETSPFHFDEQYQFELHNDTTGLDFVVVKTGDVNSSWDHSLSNQRQTEFDDKMELMVKYEQHYDDVMVTIQATKNELKDKLGLQMSVSWSTDKLYLNQASQLDKDMEVNLNNRDNGWATLLWMPEEADQISDGDIIDLIKFSFKANREDDLPKVNFTSVPTEALAYDKDFKSYKLIFNENILADREILVYPNPASQLLKLAGTTAGNEYKILNQLGEVVLTGNINPGLEVNVTTLSPGVYFIAVENNDLPQTYRFVKK